MTATAAAGPAVASTSRGGTPATPGFGKLLGHQSGRGGLGAGLLALLGHRAGLLAGRFALTRGVAVVRATLASFAAWSWPHPGPAACSWSFLTRAASLAVAVMTTPSAVFSTFEVTPSACIGQSLQHPLSAAPVMCSWSWRDLRILGGQVILTPLSSLVTCFVTPSMPMQQLFERSSAIGQVFLPAASP